MTRDEARAALEQAHHDLCTLDGLVVTDRPDLIESTDIVWRIDNRRALAALDAALSEFDAADTPDRECGERSNGQASWP